MSTHSQEQSHARAVPPAARASAPSSSARAVYLSQKRDYATRRGAHLVGGVAVPLITHTDALELVGWWSRQVPRLAACVDDGACDPEIAEWARCSLTVRGLASGPVAVGAGGVVFPDRARLWHCIKRLALSMDTRNVAPSGDRVRALEAQIAAFDANLRRSEASVRRFGEKAKAATADGADHAARVIGTVTDALAGSAAKVSAAAGRGAGEGAVRGALSAAALPAAVAGVGVVGGLLLWRLSREGGDDSA